MRINERGFAVYAEFTDTHGHPIRVQHSSSAEAPHVWIFCEIPGVSGPAPHLDAGQARTVRDALTEFLERAGEPAEGRTGCGPSSPVAASELGVSGAS